MVSVGAGMVPGVDVTAVRHVHAFGDHQGVYCEAGGVVVLVPLVDALDKCGHYDAGSQKKNQCKHQGK